MGEQDQKWGGGQRIGILRRNDYFESIWVKFQQKLGAPLFPTPLLLMMKWDWAKNSTLIKNPQFLPYCHETWLLLYTQWMEKLLKFHSNRVEIVMG